VKFVEGQNGFDPIDAFDDLTTSFGGIRREGDDEVLAALLVRFHVFDSLQTLGEALDLFDSFEVTGTTSDEKKDAVLDGFSKLVTDAIFETYGPHL
jgi:hypothetical protein